MIFPPLPTPWGRKNRKTHSTILDIVCPYFQKEYFAFLCRLVILFMLCNASIAAGAAVVFNLPVRILRSRLFCALQKISPFRECVAEFSFSFCNRKAPEPQGSGVLNNCRQLNQSLLNCGARRAAFKLYKSFLRPFFLYIPGFSGPPPKCCPTF